MRKRRGYRRDWTYETPGEYLARRTSRRTQGTFDSGVRVVMKHPKGWMLGETEHDGRGGIRVAWDRGEPVGYTSLPNPRVLHVSHLPAGAKLASSRRDRSRHRRRRDETAPVVAAPAVAPVVAGDRRRKRMPCKVHNGVHNYTVHSCGKQFCPYYWKKCPRCYGNDADNRVASRDWPGDRAGHRRAAKKGWARKRRVSRAAKLLARRRKRR